MELQARITHRTAVGSSLPSCIAGVTTVPMLDLEQPGIGGA